jgi:hypothetical protein
MKRLYVGALATIAMVLALGTGTALAEGRTSPNGAFVPQTTPTRERFNGRGGFDQSGALFMESRPVLDDEDLNVRIVGSTVFNYLAP